MTYRFLFDECLTDELIAVATAHSYESTHCNRRGLTGASDARIVDYCLANELVAVTNNAKDFLRLYGGKELHPGLIVILPSVRTSEQRQLFTLVLQELEYRRDLVNCVLKVARDGIVTVESLPLDE